MIRKLLLKKIKLNVLGLPLYVSSYLLLPSFFSLHESTQVSHLNTFVVVEKESFTVLLFCVYCLPLKQVIFREQNQRIFSDHLGRLAFIPLFFSLYCFIVELNHQFF